MATKFVCTMFNYNISNLISIVSIILSTNIRIWLVPDLHFMFLPMSHSIHAEVGAFVE